MKISEIMNGPVEMVLPNLHISALEQEIGRASCRERV